MYARCIVLKSIVMLTVSIYELLLVAFLLLVLGGKNEIKDIINICANLYHQITGFKKSITALIYDIMEGSSIDIIHQENTKNSSTINKNNKPLG
ncbi:hypothetical protein CAXC1_150040 [Candidatus Xenohaliotis californiensis]|uniref:Uncharacterized protein n=1 Tax=Candidatus Xenohaliotis californiensis TaxID=84677 RepID=A0ABP0EU53_9RICK|nr:hypothetical protein CAXC1_150040 [Candidatus Xenohaliotis californiensis]